MPHCRELDRGVSRSASRACSLPNRPTRMLFEDEHVQTATQTCRRHDDFSYCWASTHPARRSDWRQRSFDNWIGRQAGPFCYWIGVQKILFRDLFPAPFSGKNREAPRFLARSIFNTARDFLHWEVVGSQERGSCIHGSGTGPRYLLMTWA